MNPLKLYMLEVPENKIWRVCNDLYYLAKITHFKYSNSEKSCYFIYSDKKTLFLDVISRNQDEINSLFNPHRVIDSKILLRALAFLGPNVKIPYMLVRFKDGCYWFLVLTRRNVVFTEHSDSMYVIPLEKLKGIVLEEAGKIRFPEKILADKL